MADYIVDFDNKFIERLKEADKALEGLVDATNKMTVGFQKMAGEGLAQFSNAIDTIVNKVSALSATKVGDMGLTETSNAAAKVVDDVEEAFEMVQKLKATNSDTPTINGGEQYVLVDTSKLEKEIEHLDQAIKTVKRKRDDYKTKYQNLVAAESAPSKIRDAEVQFKTENKELSRLRREYKKLQKELSEAQNQNKEAIAQQLNSTVNEFMPIGALKANINEINKLIHEVPSLYPDPKEQQKVVDQLVSLRERYAKSMKSSEQKEREFAKQKSANAISLANEYEQAGKQNDRLENLEEARYESMRKWREKNIKETSLEELYAAEIEAGHNAVKAAEQDAQTFAKIENDKRVEKEKQFDAATAAADKYDADEIKRAEQQANNIRTRYKEILDELRQLEKESNRIDDLESKYGSDLDSSTATSELANRRRELNNELLAIERDHQDKISDIQKTEDEKRVKDEVDRAERAARLSIEARKREEEKAEKDRGTYRGAMAYSRSTKSIKEQIQAIKYLKEARESLNRGDFRNEKEYREALNAITLEIDRQEESIKNLKLETEKINPIGGQLKTALTNVFGVAAVKGYVNQLIRIRGEFELQQRSLQVLLRNKDEANRLWEQTIELAVKSPYRVDELVTATKQLAAYRVEANKLHSTTQMLADLSSGLGVDIQRLILAFGQVKAANFLRGTELRQFSEAGINILDELAEHYSNLEGRIVSVGDVFDRVSKRMVSFADVETVLQGMTGEGGQFYKMQEQQAETLRGQVMNLKDSVLLMYNEIGEMSDGILKGSIAVIRDVVENWKSYANIIATVIGAIAGYKSIVLLSKGAMALYNLVANAAAVVTVRVGNSATWAAARVRLLNRAMNVNPVLRFIAIVTGLIAAIGGLFISFDKTNESAKSHVQILDENAVAAKNAAAGIKKLTDERNELLKVENRSEEQEKRLNDITSARNRLLGELAEKNQEYAKSLRLAGDDTDKMSDAIEEQNAKMESQLTLAYNLSNINWDKIAEAQKQQDIKLGAEAKFKVMNKANVRMMSLPIGTNVDWQPVLAELKELIKSGAELADIVEALEIATERAGFSFIRKKDKLASLIREVFPEEGLGNVIADYIESSRVVDKAFSSLDAKISVSVEEFSRGKYGKMIAEGLDSELDESKNEAIIKLQGYWSDVFANENIANSAKDAFIRQIAEIFNLDDDWFSKKIEKELSAWQKGYNALLDALTKGKNIPSLTPITATTDIKDQVRLLKELKEEQEAIITQYADQQKYKVMLPIHSKDDADNAKLALDVINELLKALGQLAKGSGSKDTRYTNLIKTVNDVYSAFDKLEEKFGDTIATEMLWRDYSEAVDTAFKKVGKSADWVREQFGDLTDKQSLESALDWIAQNATTSEARLQAKTASAKISVDLEIEARDKEFEELTNKVEDMFSGYELAIELDKLHVPKEFAKDFFNIDAIDITELRKRLAELKPQFDAKGTEGEKEYREYLRKLDEMEVKSQQERLKKYQEFTRKAISERAKIMLDSFYEFQEIEKAFQMTNTMALNKGLIDENIKRDLDSAGKSISDLLQLSDSEIMNDWFITEDQIALLREFNAELQRQRDLTKEGATQKTKTELDKEAWEQFQTTDTFQMLMSDLENMSEVAIGKMIEQLEAYKEQWKDMPVSDIKQLVDTIEKLKDAQAAFKTPRELKRVLEGYLSEGVNVQDEETGITTATYHFDSVADAQNKLVDSELRIQALEEELALVEQIEALRTQGLSDAEILNQLKSQGLRSEEAISNALKKNSKELKANIKEEKNRKTAASKVVGVTEDIQASYKEQADRIKKVQDLTNSLFDGWEAINSLFEDDSISSFLLDMSSSILDGVLNMIMLQGETFAATVAAEGLGAAINAAMGPIGWIVLAIQVLTKALKFAFEQHDKNLQKQIDAQQEKVEKLQKAYEELEKQIEKAYVAADLGNLTREAEENLQRQIDATEKMIALEEDKKKTDEDAIKDWKDDIDDMRESIEELHEETFSTLTDGVLDNVLDATRGFVDAWHDAFLETGDGMKGLKDSFKDMMQSIVRQQASMTILGPFIDQLKGKLNQYVNTYDTMLDPAEAADLKQWFENNKDSMNESLEAYFGAFNSLFDGSGELSDLEKGIQGMTEDQAEVLAAYWNSCRFMLSNIDTTLTRMAANVLDTSGENNPIVAALNAQTEVITAIKDMFSSVIETGNGVQHNGAYLKVFMP